MIARTLRWTVRAAEDTGVSASGRALNRRLAVVAARLPQGRLLPDEVWARRHRTIVRVAAVQAVALLVFGLGRGLAWPAALAGAALVAAPLTLAATRSWSRQVRSAAASASLFTASAVLVQFWGGQTEAHFHFFVMVGLVALYQDWVPFGVGLAIVVVHHGILGTLIPSEVYSHHAAMAHPWWWAFIHAGFVLAASLTHLESWRLSEQQGLHDPLTRLANRSLLLERLTRAVARADDVAVVFVDLDDFKTVNDTRGHAAGDQLLIAVAHRLVGAAGRGTLVARLGGDEFAVMVESAPGRGRAGRGGPAGPGSESAAEAAAVELAARFLLALAEPVDVTGAQVFVHASLGVARNSPLLDDGAADGAEGPRNAHGIASRVLRDADLAMYAAKAAGKNQVVRYEAVMADSLAVATEWREDLSHALALGQFEIHYQATVTLDPPGVGAGVGVVNGFEALLRWRHPTRGLVSPAQFIPLAEESGDIVGIGSWVLARATSQAARWSLEQGRPIGVAVNLSALQLARTDLVDTVRSALADSGLPARQLTLEVTESVLVGDLDEVSVRLGDLRRTGVRVAIDDFGTGYSSLSYLARLPVDVLKIDQSFIEDLTVSPTATTLVATIVELARNLGLDTVAEGVETATQLQALQDLGCRTVQGFLLAVPVGPHEVAFDVPTHRRPRPFVPSPAGAVPAPPAPPVVSALGSQR